MELIDKSGIDEDGDGSLSKEEFLTFLRGLFLADIPSKEVESLRQAYDEAVAVDPDALMDEVRVEALFKELGFDMKSSNIGDIIGAIDADNDGDVDYDEFLTGIGMMKKQTILSKQLDTAFSNYMNQSKAAKRELKRRSTVESDSQTVPNRRSLLTLNKKAFVKQSSRNIMEQADLEDEEGVELTANDLMAFLNIKRDEAEEMVFLADQDEVEVDRIDAVLELTGTNLNCHRSIDRVEFQQLLRTWS